MSGIEVVGVIASIVQLAEVGIKLSVKLCSFYRQIKDVDHSAQRLASDISLTCSILHQLGNILEQDRRTKLCSQQAFLTTQEVLEECEKIFKQIDEAIRRKDPSSAKSKLERGTRRLTILILGPDLELLKSHLDKLKLTMLLMLNVIMYAREINRTSDNFSLECQRQLIETLLGEKAEIEAKLKRLTNLANARSDCDGQDAMSSSALVAQSNITLPQQPSTRNEIDKYYDLVKSLLIDIDACRGNFQQDRHLRIRDGVVNIHEAEIAIFQQSHGEAALQAFDCPFFRISNRDLDNSFTSKLNSKQTHQRHALTARRRHPASEIFIEGYDMDSYEAYAYTTPREQFDRDYPVQSYRHATRGSLDRHMIVMDKDSHMPLKESGIRARSLKYNISHRNTISNEASADGDDEKDDKNEDEPMEDDPKVLKRKAHDVSPSKRMATSCEENPGKKIAWGTLEDLVLSWTILSRDVIQS
ncbi:hypothetical protein N7520_002372 [Penicillium odoratum]|uniref:uncharacterized protein n=1 Tax=Penicillium odoratum TaxID=1167516 RepID=UPI0025498014|nr:uncharacterized protein N7520_002372 [Penicillium odoratum]KAJ5771843.1 hypothetical protein N7520_002372 [Penicillium odoratum]